MAEPVADEEGVEPVAAATVPSVRVLSTAVKISDVSIERPSIVAYFEQIPADKREIALVHVLEVGITELAARRERFKR